VLERQRLQLPLQALLAVPDTRDQRPRALLVELHSELRRARDQPARQLARLDVALLGDLAAGLLDRAAQRGRDLVAAFLAREERDGQALGVDALHRLGDDRHLGVLPALDAVGDHEATAERERHRVQRRDHGFRRARIAFEQLDAAGAGLALGHRAQPHPALADAAVVVAVDQVRRTEGRHGGRV
jgi:hypothetical protein